MFRETCMFVFCFLFLDENRSRRSGGSQESMFLSDLQLVFAKLRQRGSNDVVFQVRSLSRWALPIL